MRGGPFFGLAGALLLGPAGLAGQARTAAGGPVPDIRQLMMEVVAHQKQLERVRENYTYTSQQTTEDIDAGGRVTKTQSEEDDDFFVNGHVIERMVEKNGRPLSPHDEQKETERVTKEVEKAEKTPPDQPLEGPSITVSRLLEIMDVRNPRRVLYRGRPTIVFDFVGRKDARTHGLMEDASKKLQGTMWIDEADRQVAHMEVSFNANFHVAGGLVATIEKGSSLRFDQAPVNIPNVKDPALGKGKPRTTGDDPADAAELWLPTGAEATMAARVLLVKGMRQRFIERDFDYKRFEVEAGQGKAAVAPGK